jgi:hypothetical protein
MLGCALDADGNLLDADKIEWFNDPDDAQPLSTQFSSKAMMLAMLDSFFRPLDPWWSRLLALIVLKEFLDQPLKLLNQAIPMG